MEWYTKVLQNYVGFSGRARRTEFWMFALFNAIIAGVLNVLWRVTDVGVFYWLYVLYAVAVFLPSLAVGVRRLHDTNRSGWWILIGLIPIVGAIVLIVFYATEGNRGANQYGEDPKAIESGAAPATA
ncbi:DUF805 domain-containing protein [Intrasporangium sp. YIM S08009]|uniref:DUF805 domain-containing protein n=1 Tax=Intrasporangium zincisolvens TaxID=3080018 RepID=UPI002B056E78|nr:DUF805 domain-containing protein [Intrasporangium sp. YIM S08009]